MYNAFMKDTKMDMRAREQNARSQHLMLIKPTHNQVTDAGHRPSMTVASLSQCSASTLWSPLNILLGPPFHCGKRIRGMISPLSLRV